MSGKFDSVPVEEDTKIIFSQQMMFGEYDILYQQWFWDGTYGESIIFLSEDISTISAEELETMIKSSPIVKSDSGITMSRLKAGYTFVSFNFESG
jgi:hypothetical protein